MLSSEMQQALPFSMVYVKVSPSTVHLLVDTVPSASSRAFGQASTVHIISLKNACNLVTPKESYSTPLPLTADACKWCVALVNKADG